MKAAIRSSAGDLLLQPFPLDHRRGELRSGAGEISLEPRIFTLLAYFVENRGRLITREELLEKLWPDTHVSDGSLSQAVASLREALTDHARQARYIATVPRRGYKFVVDVVEQTSPDTSTHGVSHILLSGQRIEGRRNLQDGDEILTAKAPIQRCPRAQ